MSSRPKQSSSSNASKLVRQAQWAEACKVNGLSVAQSNRAASIIPAGASIKVLSWPSL